MLQGFRAAFLWQGTCDPTPWMAVPASLAVMEAFGLDAVVRRNHGCVAAHSQWVVQTPVHVNVHLATVEHCFFELL